MLRPILVLLVSLCFLIAGAKAQDFGNSCVIPKKDTSFMSCNFKGSVRNPKYFEKTSSHGTEGECVERCLSRNPECASFSYDRATKKCHMYPKKLIAMGLRKGNASTTTYLWNRHCFLANGVLRGHFGTEKELHTVWKPEVTSGASYYANTEQLGFTTSRDDSSAKPDRFNLTQHNIRLCEHRKYVLTYQRRDCNVKGGIAAILEDMTTGDFVLNWPASRLNSTIDCSDPQSFTSKVFTTLSSGPYMLRFSGNFRKAKGGFMPYIPANILLDNIQLELAGEQNEATLGDRNG